MRISVELSISYTAGGLPGRPVPTQDNTKQTHKKRAQISMPRVGFKPQIPMSERADTFHALGRAATVMIQLTDLKHHGTAMLDTRFALLWISHELTICRNNATHCPSSCAQRGNKNIPCQSVASYDYSTKRAFWLNLAWDHLLQHRPSPSKANGLFAACTMLASL
jgi:hypothetical protein